MTQSAAIELIRGAIWTGFWVAAPLLVVGFIIGLVMNVVQVATSLQDSSFAFVPKLTAFLIGGVVCMPWMFSKLSAYTISLFGDFAQYIR
jgi:flagellar biosynthesis protein FliQ